MKKIILSSMLIIFLSGLKKFILLIIILIFTLSLSGCYSIYNLSLFTLPDDAEFLACIEKLNNPQEICNYMKDNFTYKANIFYNLNPYELWLIKEGDYNDCASFALFVANYHGYKVFQIHIYFKGTFIKHILAVYFENGKYTYSSMMTYYPIYASSFNDIVLDFFEFPTEYELNYYNVYDYDNSLLVVKYNN